MKSLDRRKFLQLSGLSAIPALIPTNKGFAKYRLPAEQEVVSFASDGKMYTPLEYAKKLQEISSSSEPARDFYGQGGAIEELCKKMASITGKEKAVYIPTGTLANQLALSVLSGENSKVFVQETSHVYRDEADAAQTLFNKRLIPLAKGQPHFTADELETSVNYHLQEEVFKTGIGAVSIETPVRRCDNKAFPIEEIRKIAAYCKKNKYKLHLDGARLHIDSAFTGVSAREYSSQFDSVYLCMYKYLGATGGAVLCGDENLISRMDHLIKIHGGSIFTNWPNAVIALHNLQGIEERYDRMAAKAREFLGSLKQFPELTIEHPDGGTNVYYCTFKKPLDPGKMKNELRNKWKVFTGPVDQQGVLKLRMNETILNRDNNELIRAFGESIVSAKS